MLFESYFLYTTMVRSHINKDYHAIMMILENLRRVEETCKREISKEDMKTAMLNSSDHIHIEMAHSFNAQILS